ncbi:hypothetical protein ACIHCV_43505 [Streptomyces sp. NPDC051956]|uniref:hypothetical protein n=1 Tax=Streptomyces sp. NPDC051956 TaxID=3365677 RepID=UPI0037D66A4A
MVITSVSLSADRKTILPVEAALGCSVSQHLFLGAGPLLAVEGSSDFVFLMRMSDYLISQGRPGLDPRLAIIPVGGIGNMPAFVAVRGRRLSVRALIDGAETTKVTTKVLSAAQAANVDATPSSANSKYSPKRPTSKTSSPPRTTSGSTTELPRSPSTSQI